jgi:hypothetical protein
MHSDTNFDKFKFQRVSPKTPLFDPYLREYKTFNPPRRKISTELAEVIKINGIQTMWIWDASVNRRWKNNKKLRFEKTRFKIKIH